MRNGTNETRSRKKSAEKLGIALNILSAIFAIINGLILLPIIVLCLEHNTITLAWYWPASLLIIFSVLLVPNLLTVDERAIKRLNATLAEEQPHHILAGGCLSLLFMHLFLFAIALMVPLLEFFEAGMDSILLLSIFLFILCLAIIVVIIFGCIMAYRGKDFRGRRKIISLLAKLLFIAKLSLATLAIVYILIAALAFIGVGKH